MSDEQTAEAPAPIDQHQVDMDDQAMNDEINDMITDEYMQAWERKDKKGILESIRALVLSCKE